MEYALMLDPRRPDGSPLKPGRTDAGRLFGEIWIRTAGDLTVHAGFSDDLLEWLSTTTTTVVESNAEGRLLRFSDPRRVFSDRRFMRLQCEVHSMSGHDDP
jgi:hypothetical protein